LWLKAKCRPWPWRRPLLNKSGAAVKKNNNAFGFSR